jgi:hypothetical protein
MPLRIAACISVAATLICLPAAAHAAGAVRPSSITASTVVPDGGTSTIRLRCPAPSVALNAAVTQRGSAVTVQRSIPGSGPGDWHFKLAAAGAGSRGVRAVIRCVRLRLPVAVSGARLAVRTRREPRIAIPAGGTATSRLRCGSAWLATGYGLDAGTSGNVRLASAVPARHGWDFVLENVGSAPVSAGVSARCVRQRVSASSAELRFRTSRPSQSNALPPTRAHRFRHGCAPSQFSLATGFSVDPLDTIELAATAPFGKLWGRWTFQQVSGGDRVRTFLVCLSRQSGFR